MTPDFLKKIYESYSRADGARIHKTEGAGLGMSITKYIVDAMDGTIDIQSEPNKGTEFLLMFVLKKRLQWKWTWFFPLGICWWLMMTIIM